MFWEHNCLQFLYSFLSYLTTQPHHCLQSFSFRLLREGGGGEGEGGREGEEGREGGGGRGGRERVGKPEGGSPGDKAVLIHSNLFCIVLIASNFRRSGSTAQASSLVSTF